MACIFVIVSHYIGIFNVSANIQETFSWILPRSQSKTFLFSNLILAFQSVGINFGAWGVALFFLITGFLTAMSLDRDNHSNYLVKRAFRIYPVHIAGTAILYLTTASYTQWAGTTMAAATDFLAQASLLRDWMWIPAIEPGVWTLEVQLKMYIVYFLLHKLQVLQHSKSVIFAAGAGTAFALAIWPYADMSANFGMYKIIYVLTFSITYITYGLIGTAFYYCFCGRWTAKESLVAGGSCLFFYWINVKQATVVGDAGAYLAGVALFGAFFLIRDRIRCGRVISFISTISFSIYIIHGVNGYYLLSVLDYYGVNPYISLCITTTAALLLAYGLYRFVEKPCARMLKKHVFHIGKRGAIIVCAAVALAVCYLSVSVYQSNNKYLRSEIEYNLSGAIKNEAAFGSISAEYSGKRLVIYSVAGINGESADTQQVYYQLTGPDGVQHVYEPVQYDRPDYAEMRGSDFYLKCGSKIELASGTLSDGRYEIKIFVQKNSIVYEVPEQWIMEIADGLVNVGK